jgi:hypothetical protein
VSLRDAALILLEDREGGIHELNTWSYLNPDVKLFVHNGFPENNGFGRVTRLRGSPGHGGAGRGYRIFSGINPPRGRPTGAAALILVVNRGGGIHELNTRSFLNPDVKLFVHNGFLPENIGFGRVTRIRGSPGHGGVGWCFRVLSGY